MGSVEEGLGVDLSVIIPSAGKWSRLTACLQSLASQRLPSMLRWEILVIADGVEPPSTMTSAWPQVRFVLVPTPTGRGAARNRGAREARGEVLVFLDDDMVVTEEFVRGHWECQRQRPALCHGPIRELPVLVHVQTISPLQFVEGLSPKALQRIERQALEVVSALAEPGRCFRECGRESRLESEGVSALREGRLAAAWVAFAGANLSGPRAWFLEMPFSERAGTRWGCEDLALALRWLSVGRPLAMAEESRALHLSHPRGDWKAALDASLDDLEFLPDEGRRLVICYLKEEVPRSMLEARLDSWIREGPQQAQNFHSVPGIIDGGHRNGGSEQR